MGSLDERADMLEVCNSWTDRPGCELYRGRITLKSWRRVTLQPLDLHIPNVQALKMSIHWETRSSLRVVLTRSKSPHLHRAHHCMMREAFFCPILKKILLLKLTFDENVMLKMLFKIPTFGTCSLNFANLDTKLMVKGNFLKIPANTHHTIFLVEYVSYRGHKYVCWTQFNYIRESIF